VQQRLLLWFSTPQRGKAHHFCVNIDDAFDEAMDPVSGNNDLMPQQTDCSLLSGASQEDHLAANFGLWIELPAWRESTPSGREFHPRRLSLPIRRAIACRLCLHRRQIGIMNP
jgi:hypothetical protein